MGRFQEGSKFPHDGRTNRGTMERALFDNSIAELGVMQKDITDKTKSIYKEKPLMTALIKYDCIPIICVILYDGTILHYPVVIPVSERSSIDGWMNNDANAFTLMLINSETDIVEAVREVKISFIPQLKEIAKGQLFLIPSHLRTMVEMASKNEGKFATIVAKQVIDE